MRAKALWLSAVIATCLQAAEPSAPRYDVIVNVADRTTYRELVVLPAGTSRRIHVSDDLTVELRPWGPGDTWIAAGVLRTSDGKETSLGGMQKPPREAGSLTHLAFSVCADRIIALERESPGRCADLLPMARADRVLGTCEGYCTGPYEGMPDRIPTGETRIAPRSEPGVPLTITGRTLDADERPRAGVIVYAYQTDRQGIYPPAEPPRGSYSNHHGRLRAWVRTDADGRYTFHTIRPGSYGGNPEHIHVHVIEPGCATYQIDDVVFAGEPNLERLLATTTGQERGPAGGSGIVALSGSESGWEGTRDIWLGRNVQGYTGCESVASPPGD